MNTEQSQGRRIANSFNDSYLKILKLVEDGLNISTASVRVGMDRSTLYRKMTDKQKYEIYAAKKLHTKYGVGCWHR